MSKRCNLSGKAALAAAITGGALFALTGAAYAEDTAGTPAPSPVAPTPAPAKPSPAAPSPAPRSEAVKSQAAPPEITGPYVDINGYAMLDYSQDFGPNGVDPAWKDAFRPSKISVPNTFAKGQASLSAKQSRINFNGYSPAKQGVIHARIEFDFFGVGGDAGQFTIRPRHVYGEQGHWLGGQTNSVFMDGDVFPNTVEYWGPSGMLFYRLPQFRYQSKVGSGGGSFAASLELPGTGIDPGKAPTIDPALGDVTAHEKFPDIAAQYRIDGGFGHAQLSGIITQVGFQTPGGKDGNPSDHKTGYGVSGSAAIKVFSTDMVKLQLNYGHAIANFMNDGGNDLAGNGKGEAETVPTTAFMAYYDHYWGKSTWSSSIGYSENSQDNTDGQLGSAFKKVKYFSVNLLNSPDAKLMYGLEYMWGQRVNKDGQSGDDNRVQCSIQYKFSTK